MTLPLKPPVLPQLAKSAKTLPTGDRWSYEPKWDGFRSIAFVDGDDVYLQSRNGKPLTPLLPRARVPGRAATSSTARSSCSTTQGHQDFDALGQRIHPAKSRIDMLAEQTPTRFIAFDLLARRRRGRCSRSRRTSAAPGWRPLVDKPVDLTPRDDQPGRARRSGCSTPRA